MNIGLQVSILTLGNSDSPKQGSHQASGKAVSGGERPKVNKPEQASQRDKTQHGQPGSSILTSIKHHCQLLKS